LAAGGSAAGIGAEGSTEHASSLAAASVGASAFLPRKRHATDSDGLTEAVQDDIDTILSLSGVAKEMPESVEHKGIPCTIQEPSNTGRTSSSAWSFLQVNKKPDAKDTTVICVISHFLGSRSQLFLAQSNITNAIKHFQNLGRGNTPSLSQLVHARATMFTSKNVSGGDSINRGIFQNPMDRFVVPKTDKRSYHLYFVLMQVMSLSPHALATNDYMGKFLNNVASYHPPSPNTVTHHLAELYSFVAAAIRGQLKHAKDLYSGLPFLHIVADMWTEGHTKTSFGSLVLRYVSPAAGDMEELHLGVSLFVGRHTRGNISKWLLGRLLYFGLDQSDIASTTTDSGSNIGKALRRLPYPWNPCVAHSLNNAVIYALGAVSELPQRKDVGNGEKKRQPERSRNPSARAPMSKGPKLIGHFNHSERSVAICKAANVPHDGPCRLLITEVPTRCSSTYISMARMYTCYSTRAVFFSSIEVGAGARKRQLTSSGWDRLRPILGVLEGIFEVSTRSQSATKPVSHLLSLLVSLWRVLHDQRFFLPARAGLPPAFGNEAIESFIEEHNTAPVIVVDQYLYPAEYLYVDPPPGNDPLCEDAATALRVLRKQLDDRLFNKDDHSRHILGSDSVIMACKLSPRGSRKMQTLARLTGNVDPNSKAVWLLKDLCDRLISPTQPAPIRPTSTTTIAATKAMRRARTCLVESSDDEETQTHDQRNLAEVSHADAAKAEIHASLQLVDGNKKMDALEFWRHQNSKFPLLTLVAFSVLGAVGMSAAAERAFSTAGNIMTPNRSSLSSQHLEMHFLIRGNAHLLPTPLGQVPVLSAVDENKLRSEMPLAGRRQVPGDADDMSSADDVPIGGML